MSNPPFLGSIETEEDIRRLGLSLVQFWSKRRESLKNPNAYHGTKAQRDKAKREVNEAIVYSTYMAINGKRPDRK